MSPGAYARSFVSPHGNPEKVPRPSRDGLERTARESEGRAPGLLSMDANVLIDLCEADRAVIRLISDHVGQTQVPAGGRIHAKSSRTPNA